MSNILDFQVNGGAPAKVGGTGTTVKYFQRILGTNGPGTGVGTNPNTNISATNAAGALFLPAINVYNGQVLSLLAAGSYGSDTGDPSGTVTINVYAVTGTAAAPVYTAIGGTGAATPTHAGAESWLLSFELFGDSNSGVLSGQYSGIVNGAYKNSAGTAASVILANNISGLDFTNGNVLLQRGAVLGFVVGVTFGTSDASNTASLFEFTIES